MKYLLDSSAWLAHLFSEPGTEDVNQLFDNEDAEIIISALSIFEVYSRVRSIGQEENWQEVWETYALLFDKVLPTDDTIAHQAIILRSSSIKRLPSVDALIAATALVHKMTLVHRDPHMGQIPSDLITQIQLPEK